MIRGRRGVWVAFSLGVIVVIAGVAWLSARLLTLERADGEARLMALERNKLRLALWRMDSLVAPIIAGEAAREVEQFRAFMAPRLLFDSMLTPAEEGAWITPSPLLSGPGPFIRLHYEVMPGGELRSPQAPTGNMRDLAEALLMDPTVVQEAEILLGRVGEARAAMAKRELAEEDLVGDGLRGIAGAMLGGDASGESVNRSEAGSAGGRSAGSPAPSGGAAPALAPQRGSRGDRASEGAQQGERGGAPVEQQRRANVESHAQQEDYSFRRDAVQFIEEIKRPASNIAPQSAPSVASIALDDETEADASVQPSVKMLEERDRDRELLSHLRALPETMGRAADLLAGAGGSEAGAFVARWAPVDGGGRTLLLEREAREGERVWTQGVWIDWGALEEALLSRVGDLGLALSLEPLDGPTGDGSGDELASLPVRVVLASGGEVGRVDLSGVRASLVAIWLAVGAGVVGVWLVLRSVVRLSERRGRFVSAVTHELRTPLTTFQLYAQLLEGGMAPEHRRDEYVRTLRRESERLSGVVENVLTVARLERRRARRSMDALRVGDLFARFEPELRRIAQDAGMSLVVEDGAGGAFVPGETDAIGRILTNLVENAGKYASEAEDRRVIVRARRERRQVVIEVRDHGPGIAREDRGRIFRAFRRGAREEHGAGRGLGLGLALARGLARSMGGDLRLARRAGAGAVFELSLPIVQSPDAQADGDAPGEHGGGR